MMKRSLLITFILTLMTTNTHARFTQADTYLGEQSEPLTLNKYLYAGSAPTYFTDPSGYFFIGEQNAVHSAQSQLLTASNASATVLFTNFKVRLALGVGVAVIPTSLGLETSVALEEARKELEYQVGTAAKTKGRRKKDLLFHYSDQGKQQFIFSQNCIPVSPAYRGRLANSTRPTGAYATDIEPWNLKYSQAELANLFYKNSGRDVSKFVAFYGPDFSKLYSTQHEYVRYSRPNDCVPIAKIFKGPNLMRR